LAKRFSGNVLFFARTREKEIKLIPTKRRKNAYYCKQY
jgi:hypothetical protein